MARYDVYEEYKAYDSTLTRKGLIKALKDHAENYYDVTGNVSTNANITACVVAEFVKSGNVLVATDIMKHPEHYNLAEVFKDVRRS